MVFKIVSGSKKTAQLTFKKSFKTIKAAKKQSKVVKGLYGGKWKVVRRTRKK